jgi:hypothetical protein
LKFGLWIEGGIRAEQWKQMLLKERPDDTEALVEEKGSHERFECRGKERGPLPAARLLALSQPEHGGDPQLSCCLG